jgi:hypothetical protein
MSETTGTADVGAVAESPGAVAEPVGQTDSGSILGSPGVAPESSAESVDVAFPENWKDGLGEELRHDQGLSTIQDVPGLAKAYVHLQRQFGKDKIALPNEYTTNDERREIDYKLGLPRAFEEYSVKVPEGADFNDGFITDMKKAMYDAGVRPQQAEALFNQYSKLNQAAQAEYSQLMEQAVAENTKKLEAEWGEAFNQKMSLIQQEARAYAEGSGREEQVFSFLQKEIDGFRLAEHPEMIRLFNYLVEQLGEETLLGDGAQKLPTNSDLDDEIRQFNDMSNPIYDVNHPDHKAALQKRNALFKRRFPGEGNDF